MRLRRTIRYYIRGLYQEITDKNIFLWAQAVAFKVLITIVPVMILGTGLIGRLLRSEEPFETVAKFTRDFLPPTQSEQLIDFLAQLHTASGTLTAIGAAGLFLSAVSLFITLRLTVSSAFEQDWHVQRSIIGGYLFDARMVIQVGLLFLLTIALSIFGPSMGSTVLLEWLGLDYAWIRTGWRNALSIVGFVTPFLITTAMFFQLYYFVPKPHPRKHSALIGALVTSVLWEAAKFAFTYYATYGGFSRYSAEGLSALGNAFGLIVAFVVWVYFSSIVLMFGALIASLHEHRYRLRAQEETFDTTDVSPPPDGGPPAKEVDSDTDAQPVPDTTPEDAPLRSQES